MSLALQCAFRGARPPGRNFVRTLRRLSILRRFLPSRCRSPRRQFHSRAPRLRKPNGNCLLGRSRSMFSLPNVIHFFPDELSRLGRWRLPFPRIFSGPLHGLTLRHGNLPSLLFRLPTTVRVSMGRSGVPIGQSLYAAVRSCCISCWPESAIGSFEEAVQRHPVESD